MRKISELRSQRWFAANDMRAIAHRQRMQQMGLRRQDFMGKPVVGIVNTWSDLSPATRISVIALIRSSAEFYRQAAIQSSCRRCPSAR